MSHTLNIKTEIHDKDALYLACTRLGLKREHGEHRLYSTMETGTAVFLPGWQFPAVIRDDGTIAMDIYNGAWGNIEELNKLTAYYGIEKAKLEAWKQGYSVTEGYNDETQELTLEINTEVY